MQPESRERKWSRPQTGVEMMQRPGAPRGGATWLPLRLRPALAPSAAEGVVVVDLVEGVLRDLLFRPCSRSRAVPHRGRRGTEERRVAGLVVEDALNGHAGRRERAREEPVSG